VDFPLYQKKIRWVDFPMAFSEWDIRQMVRMDRSKGFSDDVVIFEASVTVLGQEDEPLSRFLGDI